MKYVKGTFKFIGDNYMSVLGHVIIPALIYTIFIIPTSSFDFIVTHFDTMEVTKFWDIFIVINDASKWYDWKYIVFFFTIMAFTIIIFSSYIGKVQATMKYGRPYYTGLKGVFKRTNEHMFTTIKIGVLVFFAMEIFAMSMSLLTTFVLKVTQLAWLRILLIMVFGFIGLSLAFYVLAWMICAVPNMTMRRIGLIKSAGMSTHMVASHITKIVGGILIPMIISYIPIMAFAALDLVFDNILLTIVKYLFNFLFYAFSFTYYITFMYIVFFDVNEIEREDLNLANKWRL